jgi:hypothetical protein
LNIDEGFENKSRWLIGSDKAVSLLTSTRIDDQETDRPALIDEGTYRVKLVNWKQHWLFKRPKLLMDFRVVDHDRFSGTILTAYYNVQWKGRSFSAGWKSNFMRDYQVCCGRVERTNAFEMDRFSNSVLCAEVMTNTKDAKGRLLAPVNQYSRIERLVGVHHG